MIALQHAGDLRSSVASPSTEIRRTYWLIEDVDRFAESVVNRLMPPYRDGIDPGLHGLTYLAIQGEKLVDGDVYDNLRVTVSEEADDLCYHREVTRDHHSLPILYPIMNPSVVTPLGRSALLVEVKAELSLPSRTATALESMPSFERLLPAILVMDSDGLW